VLQKNIKKKLPASGPDQTTTQPLVSKTGTHTTHSNHNSYTPNVIYYQFFNIDCIRFIIDGIFATASSAHLATHPSKRDVALALSDSVALCDN